MANPLKGFGRRHESKKYLVIKVIKKTTRNIFIKIVFYPVIIS